MSTERYILALATGTKYIQMNSADPLSAQNRSGVCFVFKFVTIYTLTVNVSTYYYQILSNYTKLYI